MRGFEFRAAGRQPLELGWRAAFPDWQPADEKGDEAQLLPPLRNGETAQLQDPRIEDKETRPPPRYNEGSLIEAMQNAWRFIDDEVLRERLKEARGIGTPATRAEIIGGLKKQSFLIAQGKQIVPTEAGLSLFGILKQADPALVDPGATAQLECLALDAAHRAQRQALYAAKEHRVRLARQAVRDRFDRKWAALYLSHQQQRENLRHKQRTAFRQLKSYLKDNPRARLRAPRETRAGYASPAFAVAARTEWSDLKKRQKKQRAALAALVKNHQQEAFRPIKDKYRADLAALRDRQRAERTDLVLRQSAQSQKTAQEIKTGADKRQFEKERLARRRQEREAAGKRPAHALRRAVNPDAKTPEIATDSFQKAARQIGSREAKRLKKLEEDSKGRDHEKGGTGRQISKSPRKHRPD